MIGGRLPQGWQPSSFVDVVVSFGNGIGGNQNKEGVGIPVSRIETIANQNFNFSRIGYLAEYDSTKIARHALNNGDILFSHINSPIHLGKTAIFRGGRPLYHGINLLRIVVNRAVIYPEIFDYFCKLTRSQGVFAMRAQHAVNQSSINQKKLGAFKIPLAPLAEQKRIADKLDTVLARVDACRERLERVPQILKRFRQSVLKAGMVGELTADWRRSLNLIDSNEVKILSEIADVIDPHPSHRTPPTVTNGVPYIGIGEVDKKGFLSLSTAKTVDWKIFEEHKKRYQIREGDFMFGKIGTLGRPTLLPINKKYIVSANVILIQPNQEKVVPKYLLFLLSSPQVLAGVAEQASATSQAAFGIKKMRAFSLSLPSKLEQHEIVRRVEMLFTFADRLEARLATARTATERLTPALLAKAFRGELVPQDPNDEPASELLKRLAANSVATGDKPRRGRTAKAEG